MLRLSALAASALIALPSVAAAEGRPSFLDLISPDRIVRSLVQGGVIALRSQMDVTYGDLTVDVAAGRIVLTDVWVWPLPDWDTDAECEITVERMTFTTTPIDRPDRFIAKLQLSGASALPVCLPPQQRTVLEMAGLDALSVPRATLDLSYGFPASDADLALFATVESVANVTLTARLDYVGVDAREDMESPDPVVFIESAELLIENMGLWEVLRAQVPPQVSDPAAARLLVEGGMGSLLANMNRSAAAPDAEGDPSALSDSQRAFIASAAEAWPAFLASPERLVLETGLPESTYFDFVAAQEDPRYVFDTLLPRVALSPQRALYIVPSEVLRAALRAPDELTDVERRAVGVALADGIGAPRNLAVARSLLSALAEAGDGAAATALSGATERSDPAEAYRWALVAGATGQPGATARLDRIESRIGLARALELQGGMPDASGLDLGTGTTLAEIRDRAARHLAGTGAPRSYRLAVFWATLGTAAGDPESADILDELDARARHEPEAGRQAWRDAEAAASALALDVWVAGDLPARFRP